MLGVFILALVLWATSPITKLDATTVAFLGISIFTCYRRSNLGRC